MRRLIYILVTVGIFFLVSCTTAPRESEPVPFVTQPPVIIAAPTATASPLGTKPVDKGPGEELVHPTLTIWVNERSNQHKQMLEEMIAGFTAKEKIQVELILVDGTLMPELMNQAVISGSVPDLIVHPVEYTAGWVSQGILRADLATAAIEQLGVSTFAPASLQFVTFDEQAAAIPIDAAAQMLVYRADWFAERGLAIPNNYEAISNGAAQIYDEANLVAGIVVPTDAGLDVTLKIFEQLAVANGCQLINDKGIVTLMDPNCLDSMDYYRFLINEYSPVGVQTEISTINAYINGQTGMIMTDSEILRIIAGLDPIYIPTCDGCRDGALVSKSGIVLGIEGRSGQSETAVFTNMNYLGISREADGEDALKFVDYWFNEGYLNWLSVEPERKIPLRIGNGVEPDFFQQKWLDLEIVPGKKMQAYYDIQFLQQLVAQTDTNRWAFPQGQGLLMSRLYQKQTLSFLLQEMLSGYFTSSQALVESVDRVIRFIPNYKVEE